MSNGDVGLIVTAAVLVAVAGAAACSESAISRVSRVHVDLLVRERRRGVAALSRVLAAPARYLELLLLLRSAAALTATVAVAVVCVDGLGGTWLGILVAASVMTVTDYVVEAVARTVGRRHAGTVGRVVSGTLLFGGRLLAPLTGVLVLLSNALTPGRGLRDGPFSSEAELRDMVDLAEERQVIARNEREMIHSVFELGDTFTREVMVPRTEMVVIERTKTVRQALSLALRSGFSRIPVFGESEDDIVGVVYLKDLAKHAYDDGAPSNRVDTAMRAPTFVPDSKPVDELLRELQARQTHLAIVIDEYGGTAGLVTIEDALEEIVGEITDEYDRELPPVEQVDADTVRVTARLPVEDVESIYRVHLEEEGVETVGGLLASALGRVPIPGATVEIAGLTFLAESAKGRRNRIGTVLIRRTEQHPAEPIVEPADA
ncbi:MAG TPA: hemolysin family protein [Mycobacteriales bacterium]|nr:hemolysin family protein [Mycobacteriales bacterium]